jgi:hypothetical protein
MQFPACLLLRFGQNAQFLQIVFGCRHATRLLLLLLNLVAVVTKDMCCRTNKRSYSSENQRDRRLDPTCRPKREVNMQIERTNSDALVVNKLPDGSTVILDAENEVVFALNSTAGAAWDACSAPTTLARVTENMQQSFDPGISEELAEEAIRQLYDKKLVKTSGTLSELSRRQFITTISSITLPLVVSLSIGEQRAHAKVASSGGQRGEPKPKPCASIRRDCKL